MTIVKWLNDNDVLISKKLADALAAFELHNSQTIDESASEFVKELVKFTKEALEYPDKFYHDGDRAGAIYNIISEDCASYELQGAIDKIESDFHEWKLGDELDDLIAEIINCTIESTARSSNLITTVLASS